MLIGDKTKFAIQFELNAIPSSEWLFGKCCFWISGIEIGKFELGESLRDFLFSIEDLAKFDRSLNAEISQSSVDLFKRLNNAVFLGTEVWDEAPRFIFAPSLETFSQVKVFMIEIKNEARLIFSESPYLHVQEYCCKLNEVHEIIKLTIYELENLLQKAIRQQAPDTHF